MKSRWTGWVSSPLVAPIAVRSWVHTTGGATPTIQASAGVGSITDAGIGLLDVTQEVALGGTVYGANASVQCSNATNLVCHVDLTADMTSTVVRVTIVEASGAGNVDIATGGLHVVTLGV